MSDRSSSVVASALAASQSTLVRSATVVARRSIGSGSATTHLLGQAHEGPDDGRACRFGGRPLEDIGELVVTQPHLDPAYDGLTFIGAQAIEGLFVGRHDLGPDGLLEGGGV